MVLISTGFILLDFLIVLVAALLAVYVYYQNVYQYWKNKGVPYLEPKFLIGNNRLLFPKSPTFCNEAKTWYDYFKGKGEKFGGVYSYTKKVLVLVDPNYIKDIFVQDFDHFVDRDIMVNEEDPITVHLFNIRGAPNWKWLRQKLTPTFTSGKMKMMFNTVVECTHDMVDFLNKEVKTGKDIDIREVLASFTTDVIGSVAFGVESRSFNEEENAFRKTGRKLFQPALKQRILMLLRRVIPLFKKLKVKRGESFQFMVDLVRQTIDYRTKNKINRPDFMQLMIELVEENKNSEHPFKFEHVVANTVLFFIAGFDTSSSAMTFTLYELARNPDVQEKARTEILEVLSRHDGKLTYESISEMTYLHQCLEEGMRKFPPVITIARICTKDYHLKNTNVTIEKGTSVVVSSIALHNDPDHFPNPEKFDPDRFSADGKKTRHPYAYLPFGEGPRNCIGLRFGLMQSKIGLATVLSNFKLSISEKTEMPLTVDDDRFLIKSNETLYLKAESIIL